MSREGFCRDERIVKKDDFQQIFREGKKIRREPFSIYFIPRGGGHRRLGIIASRKVGNAVFRNRGKRFFRDIFRKNKEAIPVGDILLILSPSFRDRSYQELKDSFFEALDSFHHLQPGK
ncbi:MAG: ribonuclease P protein component [Nitrospinota bacterium]|nr:ribonuclease P protein component [Nitrospinota bacterium]